MPAPLGYHRHMAHASYGRSGSVVYRFKSRVERDAWVGAARRGELRVPVTASELPFRLKTGRPVSGLELRDANPVVEALPVRKARGR